MTRGHDVDSDVSMLLGYTAQYRDPVSGSYPLGNGGRFYSPALMRFTTPADDARFDWINPYGYCIADPVNRAAPRVHGLDAAPTGATVAGRSVSRHTAAAGSMSSDGAASRNGGAAFQSSSSSLSAVSAVAAAGGGGGQDSGHGTHGGGASATNGGGGSGLASPVVLAALGIGGLTLGIGVGAIALRRLLGGRESLKGAVQRWTHAWGTTSGANRFLRGDVSRLLLESGFHLASWRSGERQEAHDDGLSMHMSKRMRAHTAPAPVAEHPLFRGRSNSYATRASSGYGSADGYSMADTEEAAFAEVHESAYIADEPMGAMEKIISVLGGRL